MKLFVTIACLLAAASAAPSSPFELSSWPQPSNGFTSRIINGQAATATQAPFICSMRFTPQTTPNHLCGASILNRNWVLSAAHCVTDIPAIGTLDVQCGITHRINDVINQQIRPFHRVNDVRNHPGWIANAVGPDDITVIHIHIPFVFNTFVQPIQLPATGVVPIGNCRLFGWGAINNSILNPTIPDHLQTAEKDLLTMAVCRTRLETINPAFGGPLRDSNVCAARGHIAACGGDSGGPLVVYQGTVPIQVGVVSWGISPCGNILDVPSVYVRTSAYIEWIQGHVGPM